MHPIETSMIAASVVGLGLIFSICRRLSVTHPAKYDELGGLVPIFRSTHGAARFLRFLFSGEERALADTALTVQVAILRIVLAVSTIVLVGLIVLSVAR